MHENTASELAEFGQFVGELAKRTDASISPENALDQWRELHPERLDDDDLAALAEAIEDMENGDRGVPFEDFLKNFRAAHGISG